MTGAGKPVHAGWGTAATELPNGCVLRPRVASVEEHRSLALSVGWESAYRWEAIPASLARSLAGAVVTAATGEVVAMGRLVGDGAFFFYVQDVVTHPEHRGRGLATAVVHSLQEQAVAMAGGEVFLGLFSTSQARPTYERLGLSADGDLTGMYQVLPGSGDL